MTYHVERDTSYDFSGESYSALYPNLHRYPATMLPQIGIRLLDEFGVHAKSMLDPYCGSGSSFASGLERRIPLMVGYDMNPLAVLIARAKFTKLRLDAIAKEKTRLRNAVYDFIKDENNARRLPAPKVTNVDFWFSREASASLNVLRHFISRVKHKGVRNLFLVPFSETARECSYTRNNEFKLYRMKQRDVLRFNPDVVGVYFKKLNNAISVYSGCYLPKLTRKSVVELNGSAFAADGRTYDVVLTSPPYGDSRTTVAYGQFSTLANEWTGVAHARKIDGLLMGGGKAGGLYKDGVIADCVRAVEKRDRKRALEVSAFYEDLRRSINQVAKSVAKGGVVFYIVGNRTVKKVQLLTDQFIAEQFAGNGFRHITTIKRALSGKAMPSKNSPTNKPGETVGTIAFEYIVACEKIR